MTNKKNKKSRLASFLIALGVILILGGAGWWIHNEVQDMNAEKTSKHVAEQLIEVIDEKKSVTPSENGGPSQGNSSSEDEDENDISDMDPSLMEMPTVVVDGYSYIGIIEIPSASLTLPVDYDWDYDRLAMTPCRYSGSFYTNDLVICAHDYGSHFRAIRSLGIGDSVVFTSSGGETVEYVVSNVETVQPTSIDFMIKNSSNSSSDNRWDMTLFTCNVGGLTRCAVRCVRAK